MKTPALGDVLAEQGMTVIGWQVRGMDYVIRDPSRIARRLVQRAADGGVLLLHDGGGFRRHYPHIPYVQGDACALPFADRTFDIVSSNAVVEHVGDRDRQRRFVEEAQRVGRHVFVTTPNRWFPLEVHTRLPLVHWLPDDVAGRAYDLAGKSWARENHLLGPGDLRGLFPGDVRIVNLGLTLVALT